MSILFRNRIASLALAAGVAAAAAGGLAVAQADAGANIDRQAEASEGPVAVLTTAQTLYLWGRANASPLALAAAAEMARSVGVEDMEREVERAPIDGAEAAPDPAPEGQPAGADEMLAEARDLAQGDPAMLGIIEDIAVGGTRGRIGGATRTLSRLPAGSRDTFRVPFYGAQLAELGVLGDGQADLDLQVTDETGHEICYDQTYSDQLYCSWTPLEDGYFYITVKNMGHGRNDYFLLTN